MERKEFLKLLWTRLFVPVLALTMVYFCIQFLMAIFTENGPEQLLSIFILSFTILIAIAYLTGEFFRKLLKKAFSNQSENAKLKLRILTKFIDFVSALILGAALYKFYQKDAFFALIITLVILIDILLKMIKKEKSPSL